MNLCYQLLTSDATLINELVGNKRTLLWTAATASVAAQLSGNGSSANSEGTESLLSLLQLSKTQLGPCFPEGTFQCVPQPDNFSCVCRGGFHGRYCEQRRDFCSEAENRLGGVSHFCLFNFVFFIHLLETI